MVNSQNRHRTSHLRHQSTRRRQQLTRHLKPLSHRLTIFKPINRHRIRSPQPITHRQSLMNQKHVYPRATLHIPPRFLTNRPTSTLGVTTLSLTSISNQIRTTTHIIRSINTLSRMFTTRHIRQRLNRNHTVNGMVRQPPTPNHTIPISLKHTVRPNNKRISTNRVNNLSRFQPTRQFTTRISTTISRTRLVQHRPLNHTNRHSRPHPSLPTNIRHHRTIRIHPNQNHHNQNIKRLINNHPHSVSRQRVSLRHVNRSLHRLSIRTLPRLTTTIIRISQTIHVRVSRHTHLIRVHNNGTSTRLSQNRYRTTTSQTIPYLRPHIPIRRHLPPTTMVKQHLGLIRRTKRSRILSQLIVKNRITITMRVNTPRIRQVTARHVNSILSRPFNHSSTLQTTRTTGNNIKSNIHLRQIQPRPRHQVRVNIITIGRHPIHRQAQRINQRPTTNMVVTNSTRSTPIIIGTRTMISSRVVTLTNHNRIIITIQTRLSNPTPTFHHSNNRTNRRIRLNFLTPRPTPRPPRHRSRHHHQRPRHVNRRILRLNQILNQSIRHSLIPLTKGNRNSLTLGMRVILPTSNRTPISTTKHNHRHHLNITTHRNRKQHRVTHTTIAHNSQIRRIQRQIVISTHRHHHPPNLITNFNGSHGSQLTPRLRRTIHRSQVITPPLQQRIIITQRINNNRRTRSTKHNTSQIRICQPSTAIHSLQRTRANIRHTRQLKRIIDVINLSNSIRRNKVVKRKLIRTTPSNNITHILRNRSPTTQTDQAN